MTESQATTKLIKQLNDYGYFWKASDRFRAGIPDIIGAYNKRMVALEMKIDWNRPTPLQVHTMCELAKAGAYVACVTYNNKTKLWWVGAKHLQNPRLASLYIVERIRVKDNEL